MRILKLLPRFRNLERRLAEMAARETWSRDQIEAYQLECLNRLWLKTASEVPFYRDLALSKKLPTRFNSLAEFSVNVPRLTKADVRSRRFDLLSTAHRPGKWLMTGGSTGAPTRVFWGTAGHRESLRGKYRLYQSWNVEPLDSMAFLWGHAASFKPGLVRWVQTAQQLVADRLRSRLRLSAYKTSREDMRKYLQRIRRFKPKALYGYSTAVYLLAQEALATGQDASSLKAVFMTSEPVLSAHREAVSAAFGVPAVVEYGSVECGFIAGDAADGTLRVREDSVIVETEKNLWGTFDILVTVLGNPSFPIIRYEIGDVTEKPIAKPSVGFACLSEIIGRSNDFIRSGAGRVIHPVSFMDWMEEVVPNLGRYAVHQGADASLTIEIESEVWSEATGWEDRLRHELTNFTDGLSIDINVVDELRLTTAGKHRFITSDLADSLA